MKKTITLAVIAFVLILSSCSKTDQADFLNPVQLNSSELSVKKEQNSHIQTLMYSALTTQEMTNLWVTHLQYCLNTYTLTASQESIISQGITLIGNGMLSGSPEDPAYEIYVASAVIEFPNIKQQYLVFGTLDEYTDQVFTNTDPMPNAPIGANSNCHCSRKDGHDFCGRGNFATLGVGSYSYKCEVPDCPTTAGGCGWFWLQDCNGDCKQYLFPSGGHT